MNVVVLYTFLLFGLFKAVICGQECNARNYSGIVCVCNSTYCDDFPPMGRLKPNQIAVYTSSKSGKRFSRSNAFFKSQLPDFTRTANTVSIKVDASKTYQSIHGFGGAFTDAAGINFRRLSQQTRRQLLHAYYAQNGIEYTLGRVPIASCDFSTYEYSYLDKPNDFDLNSFSLAKEDYDLKIPFILSALNLSRGELKLFASPWSAPGWMKTNERMKGGGRLKGEFNGKYYQTYAKYFVRFFEEYFKHGIKYWGVTIQNEPSSGADPGYGWQTLYFSYEMQRDFAAKLLGPLLRKTAVTQDIKLMGHDDQRTDVLKAAQAMYNVSKNESYIDGLAVHWYSHSQYEPLTDAHNIRPDKFILSTEACNAYAPGEHVPILGDWERGEAYGHDIIQNLANWVTGWTDWNLALDEKGGPNWVGNFVDAPVIVNKTADEFYKQPMFYYLGHFSKFIRPNSLRVQLTLNSTRKNNEESPIEGVAFSTPKNQRVLVIHNRDPNKAFTGIITDSKFPGQAVVELGPKSINTFVWQKPSSRISKKYGV